MEQIPFPNKKYQIIYADPPWDSNSQFGRDKKRGNEQHYPLMSIEDIKHIPVESIADEIRIPCVTAGTKKYRRNEKKEAGMRARDIITTVNETKPLPNIWWFAVGKNDKTDHTAPFPEQLANDHIISWSNEGDLVYDPFMGSGTTAKMAILNNRNWIGSEISKEYCEIAEKRINENLTAGKNNTK